MRWERIRQEIEGQASDARGGRGRVWLGGGSYMKQSPSVLDKPGEDETSFDNQKYTGHSRAA